MAVAAPSLALILPSPRPPSSDGRNWLRILYYIILYYITYTYIYTRRIAIARSLPPYPPIAAAVVAAAAAAGSGVTGT